MNITIEHTSSPAIVKFCFSEMLTPGNYEFSRDADNLECSPLAQKLLQFPFVEKVYIAANFVALQKIESVEWETLVEPLKEILSTAVKQGEFLIEPQSVAAELYAEMTPNPKVMKFASQQRLTSEAITFTEKPEPTEAPLIECLFADFEEIQEVFISDNYIAATLKENVDWDSSLIASVRQRLTHYLREGIPLFTDKIIKKIEKGHITQRDYSEEERMIKSVLDEFIKPAVSSDGGNIELVSYEPTTKVVNVVLQGACSGCPSSVITLKEGIEQLLKEQLPDKVEKVEAINS